MSSKQKSGGKLTGGYVDLDEDNEPAKKKRKVVVRSVRPTLASQFKAADISAVKQVLLNHLHTCINTKIKYLINMKLLCPLW